MGVVQRIVEEHDIKTDDGFEKAMTKMRAVPEGELHFILARDPNPQSLQWKEQNAISKAELARRQAESHYAEQKRLTRYTACAGFAGVIIGAFLQAALTWWLTSAAP